MDVRSIEQVAPSPEHQGTVPVWWLFKPREMKSKTIGGYLELVSEFEVARCTRTSITPMSSIMSLPGEAS
jgi:hypothetical protein